jgi:hypothetical protein
MIKNTSSAFYTLPSNSVAKDLASNVDPNYDILTMQSVKKANSINSEQSDQSETDDSLKKALIGVGSALAVCLLVFLAWRISKNRQTQAREAAKQEILSGGVGRKRTIQSFTTNGNLRETWTPSMDEQDRVLHGQLAETWEHNVTDPFDEQPAMMEIVDLSASRHERGCIAHDSSGRLGSPNCQCDPFQDITANRSSQQTERSDRNNTHGNALLSHLNSLERRGSAASGLTESQRIQQEYVETYSVSSLSSRGRGAASDGHSDAVYQDVYDRPQQFTSSHAFGPRAASISRTRRRASRGSIASNCISRPEMQSNSLLV